jgi:CheY-like chemotaxis protein
MTDQKSQLRELANAISRGDAVFFVGAGLSAGAGLPTWTQLVDGMRAELTPHEPSEANPMLVAQFYRNQHGDHKLFTFLRKALRTSKAHPTTAHRAMASLPVRVFYTTNYDDLLETTLKENGRDFHVIANDQEVSLWDEKDEVQVVKLHGDLDNAKSIVLTEEDYVRFMYENKAIQRKLIDTFSFRTVIFVGYSLSDPNISLIYNNLLHELGHLKRPAYILTFDAGIHKTREWERRKIFPIVIPKAEDQQRQQALDTFFKELKQEVTRVQRQAPCDIIIVEDDLYSRDILHDVLASRYPEASIECATDGLEALMLIARRQPKVILADLRMPRMDGWELMELLRKSPEHKETRIILISANEVDAERAASLNVDEIIRKPIPHAQLLAAVDRAYAATARLPKHTRRHDDPKKAAEGNAV